MTPLIDFHRVSKQYGSGEVQVRALDRATFSIPEGSFTAIYGPSGSGKSTLLNLIGLLDRPTSGVYRIRGVDTATIRSDRTRARLRRETFGFIFQQFNLLPKLSAFDNVLLPAIYAGRRDRKTRATRLLERVGLADRLSHRPSELSGGQQQRVAIARALMNEPTILLADEPTGNLDRATGESILTLLHELHANGQTVILVTHDPASAAIAQQILSVVDGKVTAKSKGKRQK
jgi:ABC-type lipoprotein export system ATPase subunit